MTTKNIRVSALRWLENPHCRIADWDHAGSVDLVNRLAKQGAYVYVEMSPHTDNREWADILVLIYSLAPDVAENVLLELLNTYPHPDLVHQIEPGMVSVWWD